MNILDILEDKHRMRKKTLEATLFIYSLIKEENITDTHEIYLLTKKVHNISFSSYRVILKRLIEQQILKKSGSVSDGRKNVLMLGQKRLTQN